MSHDHEPLNAAVIRRVGDATERADRYVAMDGTVVTAPLRAELETLETDLAAALAEFTHQLAELTGPVGEPTDWELARWDVAESGAEDEDGDRLWLFAAEYVWVPRLAPPGADT